MGRSRVEKVIIPTGRRENGGKTAFSTGGSAVCGGGAAHPGRGRGQGIDNRLAQAVLP